MSKLLNGQPVRIGKGIQTVTVSVTSGTVQLQYKIGELPFRNIPDSLYSADADENKQLPACEVQAVITGVAKVYISESGV